jgi:hypothetical protein
MKVEHPYVCDGCGAPKREVNQWWIVFRGAIFQICAWDEETAEDTAARHMCSQTCASKELSQWMAERLTADMKGKP